MSDQHPPAGDSSYGPSASGSTPDYGRHDLPTPPPDTVTLGGGAWNDPKGDKRGRTWWYVGGGAVAAVALVAGGTVYAATQLRPGHDAGAAAALPGDALLYAGIDLDPNAGQKIEAIQALRKFPAFTQGVKLNPSSDLRKLLVQDELKSDGCSLDWEKDVSPWLGNDVGTALIPASGDAKPQPVAVLAVTDEAAAKKDLPKLLDCAQLPKGLAVANGWAVVASSDSVAQGVSSAAKSGSLADDDDFKTWVDRTGDPGVVTLFASKDAGRTLAGYADQAISMFESFGPFAATGPSFSSGAGEDGSFFFPDDGSVGGGSDSGSGSSDGASSSSSEVAPAAYTTRGVITGDDPSIDPFSLLTDVCPGATSGSAVPDPSQLEQQKKALEKLQGGAATLRFAGGGFELESATGVQGTTAASGSAGLTTLPDDTAVAFGSATGAAGIDTWVDEFATGIAQECGSTSAEVLQGITKLTGLTLPADLNTLLGKGVTFAASGSIDPEALSNSSAPSDLAAGLKLQGDPDQITAVLKKLKVPGVDQILGTTSGDGVVAVGPDADYRAELVKHGSLGKTDAFTNVIPNGDKASSAFFVSFDNLRTILASPALGIPADVRDNLEHLQALGASSWVDDGVTHGLLRLSTQ